MRTWTPMWACLAFVLVSTPGLAGDATPDPSLRYQVVDVAADDRLNVRDHAGVAADAVGSLPPAAEDVVITGAVMRSNASDWWEIVFGAAGRGKGWVNGRYLAVMDRDERERDYPLTCGGTEPFWSLDLERGQASYSDIDEVPLTMSAGPWRKARGLFGSFAVELARNGQIGTVAVWRERYYCSDGMSEIRYPFATILIRPDGEVLAGCCRRSR